MVGWGFWENISTSLLTQLVSVLCPLSLILPNIDVIAGASEALQQCWGKVEYGHALIGGLSDCLSNTLHVSNGLASWRHMFGFIWTLSSHLGTLCTVSQDMWFSKDKMYLLHMWLGYNLGKKGLLVSESLPMACSPMYSNRSYAREGLDTSCPARKLRKWQDVDRDVRPLKTCSHDLLSPLRPHILKFQHPSKVAPFTGDQTLTHEPLWAFNC